MRRTTETVAIANKDTPPLIVLLRSGFSVFACHRDLARSTSAYRTTASCGFIGTSDHQHLVIPLDHPRKTLRTSKMEDFTHHDKRGSYLLKSANSPSERAEVLMHTWPAAHQKSSIKSRPMPRSSSPKGTKFIASDMLATHSLNLMRTLITVTPNHSDTARHSEWKQTAIERLRWLLLSIMHAATMIAPAMIKEVLQTAGG